MSVPKIGPIHARKRSSGRSQNGQLNDTARDAACATPSRTASVAAAPHIPQGGVASSRTADIPLTPSHGAHRNDIARYERRQIVFHEGAAATHLYEVLEGAVIVCASAPSGRRQILEIVGPGSWFGLTSGAVHASRAETLTGVVLRLIDRAGVMRSSRLNAQLSRQVMARLDALHAHAVVLARTSAMERIAAFLLDIRYANGAAIATPGLQAEETMAIAMNQRDIGDYLGLKVETVSRKLAILKKRMIIATGKRGHFRLLDISALRRLANIDAAPCLA